MSVQTDFDAAYKAHFNPQIQALLDMPTDDITARQVAAENLAEQGMLIDNAIMVWCQDPYLVNEQRLQMGETWTPSFLQQPLGAPNGVALPGESPLPDQSAYDPNHPPAGSIINSLNIADYPPFNPVPAPSPTTDHVGRPIRKGSKLYTDILPDPTPVGVEVTDSRGKFVRVKVIVGQTPFGEDVIYYYRKMG